MTVIRKHEGCVLEDDFRVKAVRRFLPPDGDRKFELVQFWAEHGGLRTVRVKDIVL